jgi:ABC transporter substrate binding protein
MNWKRGISTTVSVLLSLILLGSGSAEARPRVAFLTLGDQQMDAVYVAAFVEGLRRLGYVEGRNLDIDYRYTAGAVERLKPLAQELVALHPDVLVGSEPSAARALKEIAPASPIVCLALTDALIPDLIASYARPGAPALYDCFGAIRTSSRHCRMTGSAQTGPLKLDGQFPGRQRDPAHDPSATRVHLMGSAN